MNCVLANRLENLLVLTTYALYCCECLDALDCRNLAALRLANRAEIHELFLDPITSGLLDYVAPSRHVICTDKLVM